MQVRVVHKVSNVIGQASVQQSDRTLPLVHKTSGQCLQPTLCRPVYGLLIRSYSELTVHLGSLYLHLVLCAGPRGNDGATGPKGGDGNNGATGPQGDGANLRVLDCSVWLSIQWTECFRGWCEKFRVQL